MIEIKIDEKKIMKDVLNYDGSLHNQIKNEIENNIVKKIVRELEEEYFDTAYYARAKDEIKSSIENQLGIEQRNIFRKIMKSFKDKYRWSRNKDKLEKLRKCVEDIANEKEEVLEEVED